MDHTLRLIQHNWVVLAYNLNIIILVLITRESRTGASSAYHFITVLSLLLALHYHFIPALAEYQT
jgi:hypothetical protein